MCFIAKLFYNVVYLLFGTLLTISAALLDVVIQVTILKFANWIETVTGVRLAWAILRDVMNITFIFLLLYAAISMILGLGKEKGIVKGVILAGLLINFSFFFTSVIIDASNVLTVEMFEAIQRIGERSKGQATDVTKPGTLSTADGITNVFMQGLGIQTQSPTGLSANGEDVDPKIFQQLVFSSIAILIIAFVFFAMALLLLGRFIVLLILLITSPVSVMGGLFPQIAEHSKRWWKTLIEQVVFAPMMMLFMLVTVLIVDHPSFKTGLNIGESSVDVPFAGDIAGMINYAIVIGLLLTGIVVAKKSSGAASSGLSDWAIKKAQAVPTTSARWAGQKATAAVGGVSGAVGRKYIGETARTLGGKYDLAMGKIAGSGAAGKRFAEIARGSGVDEGIRDTFKGIAAAKFGSQVNLAEREKQIAQRKKEIGQSVREDTLETQIETGLEATATAVGTPAYDSSAAPIKEYLEAVGKLTNNKIEEMLSDNLARLKDPHFAAALTSKQMDFINDSHLINDTERDEIKAAREKGIAARIGASVRADGSYGAATQAAEVGHILSGKASEIAKLSAKLLTSKSIAPHLSVDVLRNIVHDRKMSETDKATIRTAIETAAGRLPVTPSTTEEKRLARAKKWLEGEAGFEF